MKDCGPRETGISVVGEGSWLEAKELQGTSGSQEGICCMPQPTDMDLKKADAQNEAGVIDTRDPMARTT